jgi:hypothetical protein
MMAFCDDDAALAPANLGTIPFKWNVFAELKKRMAEYEQSFARFKEINDQINELKSQFSMNSYGKQPQPPQ